MSILFSRAKRDVLDDEDQHEWGKAVSQYDHEDCDYATDAGDRVGITITHSRHTDDAEVYAGCVILKFGVYWSDIKSRIYPYTIFRASGSSKKTIR